MDILDVAKQVADALSGAADALYRDIEIAETAAEEAGAEAAIAAAAEAESKTLGAEAAAEASVIEEVAKIADEPVKVDDFQTRLNQALELLRGVKK